LKSIHIEIIPSVLLQMIERYLIYTSGRMEIRPNIVISAELYEISFK